MARARQSPQGDKENTKTAGKGRRPPRICGKVDGNPYAVYADYSRPEFEIPKLLVLTFAELYAAKFLVGLIIGDDTYEPTAPLGHRQGIRTSTGIRITMSHDGLQRVMEYQPTTDELEWDDDLIRQRVLNLKYGRGEDDPNRPTIEQQPGDAEDKLPKQGRAKDPRVPKAKVDRAGMVTANDLAVELGVEGREVRAVLRALQLTKPEGGWAFDKKAADEIREKVKAGLKEKKK